MSGRVLVCEWESASVCERESASVCEWESASVSGRVLVSAGLNQYRVFYGPSFSLLPGASSLQLSASL